jgi:hypothetical protein
MSQKSYRRLTQVSVASALQAALKAPRNAEYTDLRLCYTNTSLRGTLQDC